MKPFTPHLLCASLAAVLTLCLSAPAQSHGATPGMGPVAQQEKAVWDALQADHWDSITSMMAPNFVYVGEQISDRAHSQDGLKSCKLNSYTLHDSQTRTLAKGIVLVTYVTTVDQVCGSQPFKGDLNCSTLWQQANGKWMAIAHSEATAAKP